MYWHGDGLDAVKASTEIEKAAWQSQFEEARRRRCLAQRESIPRSVVSESRAMRRGAARVRDVEALRQRVCVRFSVKAVPAMSRMTNRGRYLGTCEHGTHPVVEGQGVVRAEALKH